MSKIKYLIRCIIRMDYKGLFQAVNRIHKRSKKPRIPLFFDIVKCGLKFGAGYWDYELFGWWDLNDAERATHLTRGINNTLVKICNAPEARSVLIDKVEFNEFFSDVIGRKWIKITPETTLSEFEEFMQGLRFIISKPLDECGGKGVEKLDREDFEDLGALLSHLISSGNGICEEYIVQHSEMSRLYPVSVNTLRLVSIIDDGGDSHILYAAVRFGNGGRVVDNISSGGLTAPIDVETGTVSNTAFDKGFNYYEVHPYTDTKIVGFKIPMWQEAMELVKRSALRIPKLRYVGWDIAITENGPIIVEANHVPGIHFIQIPAHTPDKIGVLPLFRKYIKF